MTSAEGEAPLARILEGFRARPSLAGLRAALVQAERCGRRPEVRACLLETLEAGVAREPRLVYRLYLEDGDDLGAAAAARQLGHPSALLDVADATRRSFRALSIQLYLEAADALARQGTRRAYARAALALSWCRALMAGEEVRWVSWFGAFRDRHRRRRTLLQELVRAGLDPEQIPPQVRL